MVNTIRINLTHFSTFSEYYEMCLYINLGAYSHSFVRNVSICLSCTSLRHKPQAFHSNKADLTDSPMV